MKVQLIMNSKVKEVLFIYCKFVFYDFNIYFFLPVTDDVPEELVANIHQDDDGFESLNGNVSSDNDRAVGRALTQGNKSRLGIAQRNKDHLSRSEDSTSQQIPFPSKNSGLIYKYML